MFESIQFRAYPTPQQEQLLAQMFGNQRFIYNCFLEEQKRRLEAKEPLLSRFDMQSVIPDLMREFEWLRVSKVDSLRLSIYALDKAFKKFFTKQAGFPRFKKRSNQSSVATSRPSVDVVFSRNLGPLRCKRHRGVSIGTVKNFCIRRVPSGKYFQSVTVETPNAIPVVKDPTGFIGLDEGLTTFLTLSTGRKIKHGKHYKANLARLKREQRRFSRKQKGSKRREAQRIRVAKIHEKITNSRSYEIHLVTSNLVRKASAESQGIAFQKSNVVNQMQNRKLAGAISDASWGELRRQLRYKCERAGVALVEVDQWEATSYPCFDCGQRPEEKSLSMRDWTCSCGKKIDRDVNAARNIARLAMRIWRREAPLLDAEAGRPAVEASSSIAA